MSIIVRMRRQYAVYWRRTGTDRFGRNTFEDPVEIRCRWEDGSIEMRTEQGNVLQFNTIVYVDRAVQQGDYLRRGEMPSDVPSDPTTDSDALPVQRRSEIPNMRATKTLYIAYL